MISESADDHDLLADFIGENTLLAFYLVALGIGSLISFFLVLQRLRRDRRFERRTISPWAVQPFEFLIFIVILMAWFVLAGPAMISLVDGRVSGDESRIWATLAGGVFMQLGMGYIFIRCRFQFRNTAEGPLSPRQISLPQAAGLGLLFFLASLPVIYLASVSWTMFLQALVRFGIDVDLAPQQTIMMFQQLDSLLMIAALCVLAVVIAPVVEELVFRGGIFRYLKGRLPQGLAVIISSILFAMIHGHMQSLAGLFAVGICLCLAYEWTGNLRVPVFLHAFFNLNTLLLLWLWPEALL